MATQVTYRPGPVGALMDEYERAAADLRRLIERIPAGEYEKVADPDTEDPDCRSLQTIVSHVVGAGYSYAAYLRTEFGMDATRPPRGLQIEHGDRLQAFDDMLDYTRATLDGRWTMGDQEQQKVRVESRWGSVYDFEQLMEHAIVHILRHRRQIERYLAEGRVRF